MWNNNNRNLIHLNGIMHSLVILLILSIGFLWKCSIATGILLEIQPHHTFLVVWQQKRSFYGYHFVLMKFILNYNYDCIYNHNNLIWNALSNSINWFSRWCKKSLSIPNEIKTKKHTNHFPLMRFVSRALL